MNDYFAAGDSNVGFKPKTGVSDRKLSERKGVGKIDQAINRNLQQRTTAFEFENEDAQCKLRGFRSWSRTGSYYNYNANIGLLADIVVSANVSTLQKISGIN
jgi:hypothetical protein